jgi:CRISPR-associated protein Csb1
MTASDSYSELINGDHVAIRMMTRLIPAGGPQTKVFPPTYIGEKTKSGNIGKYAYEDRLVDGRIVKTVLLDSVQSQANRMEQALLKAYKSGEIKLPLVTIKFKSIKDLGIDQLTSLEVPHRLADAIILYSMNGDTEFRNSEEGKALEAASIANATPIFKLSPTALIFGQWLSHGQRGGLGNKFPRTIVSEIVGYNAVDGTNVVGRIDPLPISAKVPVYRRPDGEWTLDEDKYNEENKEKEKKGDKNKYNKEKASNIGLGNVAPSSEKEGKKLPGGVTISYAEQVGVLSLIAIRRLRFPDLNGKESPEINKAAHAVLATLALCAMSLQIDQGFDLRSRCFLIPDGGTTKWEFILRDGSSQAFSLDSKQAIKMFNRAVEEAKSVGVPWVTEPLTLTPSDKLRDLIKKSIQVQAGEDIEAAE